MLGFLPPLGETLIIVITCYQKVSNVKPFSATPFPQEIINIQFSPVSQWVDLHLQQWTLMQSGRRQEFCFRWVRLV